MENLKPRGGRFRYRSAEIGPVVNVTVQYEKGEQNFFSGERPLRGIYVIVSTSELVEVAPGRIAESFKVFGEKGFRALVMELGRGNPKKFMAVSQAIDPLAPEIARLFEAGQAVAAKALALSPFRKAEATA